MKGTRKSGTYWVFYERIWKAAEYSEKTDSWIMPGLKAVYKDEDFALIDKIITPPQKKKL